jgi:uncharacterized membrane protein YeaQ/YmgE (transglycosylase-associated protein family)
MSLLAYIIFAVVSGLLVGALARLSLPGPDPLTLPQTILLGVAGNVIAGAIVALLWDHRAPGILIAVASSSAILYFVRRSRGGGFRDPGHTSR